MGIRSRLQVLHIDIIVSLGGVVFHIASVHLYRLGYLVLVLIPFVDRRRTLDDDFGILVPEEHAVCESLSLGLLPHGLLFTGRNQLIRIRIEEFQTQDDPVSVVPVRSLADTDGIDLRQYVGQQCLPGLSERLGVAPEAVRCRSCHLIIYIPCRVFVCREYRLCLTFEVPVVEGTLRIIELHARGLALR